MGNPIDLYQLLPAVYRGEDARRGYPLKALLAIISEQANVVKTDIDRLWDNFFVETADAWVLPYLGDLVGNTPIHAIVRGRRADIAKTVSYRLRKGTLPMLEELARDVTGWSVHAVAFFDLLTWTQNMNHQRSHVGTIHLRDLDLCDRVHTAFDGASHNVDLRPSADAAGWHAIPKLGFFIWRLGSYEVTGVQSRQAVGVPFGYHFHPLGIPQPLFNTPTAETDVTGLAGEIHIAQPIRPIAFLRDPGRYFRPNGSIGIRIDSSEIRADEIVCMDLSTWRQRTDGKIGVDVRSGRFALPSGMTATTLDATFHYGFSADLGGGSYERRADATIQDPEFSVAGNPDEPGDVVYVPGDFPNIQAALAAWTPATTPRLIIQIEDSRTYGGDLVLDQNATDRDNVQVVIQAKNRTRPLLIGSIVVPTDHNPARVALKGLLIEGNIRVEPDSGLDVLEVLHCTLVPGLRLTESMEPVQPNTPSIDVGANNDLLDVVIDHSISGPLRIPPDTRSLYIGGSIVDNLASPARGQTLPGLLSGALTLSDAVAAVNLPITIRIGDETHTVRLLNPPATLEEVALVLEAAMRAADGATPAFTLVRVLWLDDGARLLIMPGIARLVVVGQSQAADLLALNPGVAHDITLLLGAPVADLSVLTTPPQLAVVVERVENEELTLQRFEIALVSIPATPEDGAADLQSVLRTRPELVAADIFVTVEGGRLLVYSLEAGVTLRFLPHSADPHAVVLLGLLDALPAIGYTAAGTVTGPETTVEASTILGGVFVRAMMLATNSIFADTVICQRRQFGCMRFSYVPPASVTSVRYRCEPEHAAETAADRARQQGLVALAAQARERALRRVQPQFTTRRYGLPAYLQLTLDCAEEIRTGADNGAEMGVFNLLLQPQRQANLNTRLEEYLPFGLEAALIFVD